MKFPIHIADFLTVNGKVNQSRDKILSEFGVNPASGSAIPTENKYLWYYNSSFIDWDYLNHSMSTSVPVGGCSAIYANGIVGRSLDWYYSEQVDFICSLKNNDVNIMGIAGSVPDATYLNVASGSYDFKRVPGFLQDGINSYGLHCSILVVPRELNVTTKTVPLVEEKYTISSVMVPLHVLARAKSVDDAVSLLRDYTSVVIPQAVKDMGYEAHYFICDPTKSVVAEFNDNHFVFTDSNLCTNFHVYNVQEGYLPGESLPALGQGFDFKSVGYTNSSSGIERWRVLADENPTDVDSMKESITKVQFSKAYQSFSWLSDYIGGTATINSPTQDFLNNYDIIQPWYEKRPECFGDGWSYRRGDAAKTWLSTHQVVYDLNSLTMSINPQESNRWLEFSMI